MDKLLAKFANLYNGQNEYVIVDKNLILNLLQYIDNSGTLNQAKGIALLGNIGSGKTTLVQMLQRYSLKIKSNKYFRFENIKAVERLYERIGYEIIEELSECNICIDDVGTESPITTRFGNKLNIFEEIIEAHYANGFKKGKLLHFTTNLTAKEIKQLYSPRITDRLREMVQIIVLLTKESFRR